MTVSLNGQTLPMPSRRQPIRYSYEWLEYDLPRGVLRRGANEVGVALHARPSRLVAQVALESVEVAVSYAKPVPEAD